MPFIDQNLDDVHEPSTVPDGKYDLTIAGVEEKTSQSGRDMRVYRLRVENPPEGLPAQLIYHNLMKPRTLSDVQKDGTPVTEQQIEWDLLAVKRFCKAFDIDPNDDVNNQVGAMASSIQVNLVPMTDKNGNETADMRNECRFPKSE